MDPESLLLAGLAAVFAVVGARRQQTATAGTPGQQVSRGMDQVAVRAGALVRSTGRVATGVVAGANSVVTGAATDVARLVGDTTSDLAGVAVAAAGQATADTSGKIVDGVGVMLSLAAAPFRRGR